MTEQGGVAAVELLEEGCPADLAARGYGRERIFELTGVDLGGNVGRARPLLKGVDRTEYKIEHVRVRHGVAAIEALLDKYGDGDLDGQGFMVELGLLDGAGPSIVSSFTVGRLCRALGLADQEYAARKRRVASPEAVAKQQATIFARYGVKNISQLDSIKERKKATTRKNYGADHHTQTEEGQRVRREAAQRKYGVDNVSQAAEIKQRKAETSMRNFGAPSYLESADCQVKLIQALRDKYGDFAVDLAIEAVGCETELRPFSLKSVLETAAMRCEEVHGVRNIFDLPDTQDRIRQVIAERYGVDNVSRSPEIQRRRRQTFIERFGTDNPYQNEEVKAKIIETNLERYGFPNASMSEAVKAKNVATRRENGTFHISKSEVLFHQMLIEVFGEDDVEREHRSDPRYPFSCDFYIRSRDLFIELQGVWTHGGHWYDETDPVDVARVQEWLARDSDYYRSAVTTWTVSDVRKRETARAAGLNYVAFWDGSGELSDARLWLAMGCPDGQDWERMYSWLPERELDLDAPVPAALPMGPRQTTAEARRTVWRTFYAREVALWEANSVHTALWGTEQARLYANRLKYMGDEPWAGKTPAQISDLEILRGFAISGRLRAYSVFDNTGMVEVLEKYEPVAVYDPCAGWGERLLTCAARDVVYEGTDINPAVAAAHAQLVADHELAQQRTVAGDASVRDMRSAGHDMVFTCPPYGSLEKYTERGAENLDPEAFLLWWAQVIQMSVSESTTVVAYQINQAWKDQMNAVVQAAGWTLVDQIPLGARSSHMTRGKGVDRKREYEEVQVFERAL